jgi:hypothetical protein
VNEATTVYIMVSARQSIEGNDLKKEVFFCHGSPDVSAARLCSKLWVRAKLGFRNQSARALVFLYVV